MKILILKRDKIGDMLLVTPMLEHLRRSLPQAQIHMLANDYNAWLVQHNPNIDRLWVYPRVRHGASLRPWAVVTQFIQRFELKREKFDFAIAAGGVVSSRAVTRIMGVGARRTVAYVPSDGVGTDPLMRRLTDPLPYDRARHEVESNLHLLSPVGIAPPGRPIYPHYVPEDPWLDSGERWVREQGLTPGKFILIGLNARRVKRKPTARQILAWSLHFKQKLGLDSVLIWQPGPASNRVYPGDDEIVGPLLAALPPWLKPFSNPEDVRAALGVAWHAALSILPDGGFAHLASVTPGGVVALFAETGVSPHPDNWRPYVPRSAYLEAAKTVSELLDTDTYATVERLLALPLQG
jgi:heptosyltransferase-3